MTACNKCGGTDHVERATVRITEAPGSGGEGSADLCETCRKQLVEGVVAFGIPITMTPLKARGLTGQ